MSGIVIAERPLPPPPEIVRARQFRVAAARLGYITEAEAESWATRNALPAIVLQVIATLPQDQQFEARMTALDMSEAIRLDPMMAAALSIVGATEADRDALFRLAATL